MKEFLCETQDLAIGYGKTSLASGIALGADPGQIFVLVGPNGAGIMIRTLNSLRFILILMIVISHSTLPISQDSKSP